MAISISSTPAGIILNAMDTRIAGGNIVFQTSGDVEVATLGIAATNAFTIAGNVATYKDTTADTSATGGVIAKFKVEQSDLTEEYTGTCTATGGGGDITMANLTISAGATFDMNDLDPITFTLP